MDFTEVTLCLKYICRKNSTTSAESYKGVICVLYENGTVQGFQALFISMTSEKSNYI
jgi:hypothetical protein